MTFYSVRKGNDNVMTFAMNPFLRVILAFAFFSILLTFAINMTAEEFTSNSAAGQISTVLMPLLFFLGSCYRYSFTFDREKETCTLKRGLVFLNRTRVFSFDDLTSLNYRVYDYHRSDEGNPHARGIPRRSRADFGFFFNGKLVQLEKNGPRKGVEALYLSFTSWFPRELPAE